VKLTLIAIGHRMPSWVQEAYADYAKRLPPDWAIELKELKPETAATQPEQIKLREAVQIRAAIPKDAVVLALDERGKDLSTAQLADAVTQWQSRARQAVFLIGGAQGLDQTLKQECDGLLRLSSLTLPHMLVRILVAEQWYRAWSILHQHPYHRA
jgi:23S rRNA (pseudouridine1915-N3)-methyltransferase